jgi:hypothetical protein
VGDSCQPTCWAAAWVDGDTTARSAESHAALRCGFVFAVVCLARCHGCRPPQRTAAKHLPASPADVTNWILKSRSRRFIVPIRPVRNYIVDPPPNARS